VAVRQGIPTDIDVNRTERGYVNDAVPALPFFGRHDTFYRNNSGRARVLVQRLRLPAPPK